MLRFQFGFYFVLFLFSLCLIPAFSFAQTPNTIDSIEVRLAPENPAPKEPVTLRVEGYLSDLNKATITWIVDGKQISSGIGQTSFKLDAPDNGKRSTISISIRTFEGREVRKTIVLQPGDVSIMWETTGNIPPLYRGKSLPAYQTNIKFVAMPELYKNGVRLDPSTLVYTWKKGSVVLGTNSGYGKQSLTLKGGVVPQPMEVSVTVQSRDGISTGKGSLTLDFQNPELYFYQEDPLYGVLYNKALGSQQPLLNEEMKVVAVPYFYDNPREFVWSVNNVPQASLDGQSSIILRNGGTVGGSSLIGVQLRNTVNILQAAQGNFTVYFNKIEKAEVPEL